MAVNLIDADRQWFKSEIGLGVREMPLDDSICKFALLETSRLVVCDTQEDDRFRCNPLVTGAPGLRFYAGEVLKTPEGLPLGTLCVLDTTARPQGLTALQALALKTLAQQVLTQLELRKLVFEQERLLTEQQRTNAALLLAQERSRLATEAAGLGLWSWDPQRDTVTWEDTRTHEILGLSASDEPLSAQRFMDEFLHPDDVALFAAAAALTMETGARFQFQGRLIRKSGEVRWIDFLGKPQPVHDGESPLILGVVSDITERKVAEVELRDSRTRFEQIVSQAATGVVQAGTDGRITVVNQKFCDMLGYPREQLLTMALMDITAAGSRASTLDVVDQLLAGAEGVVVQKQYLRADGVAIWASSSVSAVRGPHQEFEGIVAIVVDISDDRRVEENLRQLAADLSEADRRKSDFLATLAHELRNPLAPISTGLSVLKLAGDSPAMVTKLRPMMERQLAQMVRLIDDLLDVARISGGKIHLQKSVVQLRAVLAAACETSMPAIERGAHRLVVRQPDDTLWLDADPTRIAQVLSNLLNNAAKYTPRGGLIEVDARKEGANVVVVVSDNGIGMPPEALPTIFDMFNQVHQNMDHAQGGLGVGLSLVQRLVQMHGGSVEAFSAGPGKGSVFTVQLPLAIEGERAQIGTAPPTPVRRASLRVLVADDNVDAAESLAAMFALQGHETRVVHSGTEALAAARGFAPQVAFLDIGMPGMNGYETAVAIRALPGMQSAVLVALTGWGNESDRERSKAAGFDHHLTKPANAATIALLLDDL